MKTLICIIVMATFVFMDLNAQDIYYDGDNKTESITDMLGENEELLTADDGFTYIRFSSSTSPVIYGAKDINGKVLIPLDRGYTWITYYKGKDYPGFFGVEVNYKKGACDITGRELVKCLYDSVIYYSDGFNVKNKSDGANWRLTGIFLDSNGVGYRK